MTAFAAEPAYQHGSAPRSAVLLVNLGTPDAPEKAALRRYLKQFLSGPRLVETPGALWWTILRLRQIDRMPLRELVPYIDWTPFFHTWELRGRYPGILEEATVGPKAKELLADTQALLEEIIRGELLTARGVYGFFPANSIGDVIELYRNGDRREVLTTFHTLGSKPRNRPISSTWPWPTMLRPRRPAVRTMWRRLW